MLMLCRECTVCPFTDKSKMVILWKWLITTPLRLSVFAQEILLNRDQRDFNSLSSNELAISSEF